MWKDWRIVKWAANKLGGTTQEASSSKKKNNLLKKLGLAFDGTTREQFKGPEGFEIEQIERAYLTDSYIRLAIDKYVDFMFKAGWTLSGKNPKTVEYVKQRFAAMAQATQIPTDQLLIDIAEELVKYHNVFIIKARANGSYQYPPGLRVTPIDGGKPVAGYFVLPTSTVEIDRNIDGTVRKYRQTVEGADELDIKPTDMVHIYADRQAGRAFGTPFLWEVLDDVKMLRQLEELVDRMIYKNIFPLLVYQVGLDKEGFQSTDEEVEEVREMLGELTLDGGIVLPERHNIKAVGAEGKALQVEEYLRYFEKRVFTGLGVSETMMGRGDTANRSTSDNLDAAFKDRIKAYQKIMTTFINDFLLNELLYEGGYDPVLKEPDKVYFTFKEIDFDSKIKQENHAIQKFTQNAITHEELRMELSLDPVTDESRLYYQMVTMAIEDQKQANAANAAGDNKNRPENQSGKKLSPKKESVVSQKSLLEMQENIDELEKMLYNKWEMAKVDTIESIRRFYANNPSGRFNTSVLDAITNLTVNSMMPIINKFIKNSFVDGVNKAKQETNTSIHLNINYDYNTGRISDEISRTLRKLMTTDLIRSIEKTLDKEDRADIVAGVVGAFDALRYRLKFLATTEKSKAFNAGFSRAARMLGYTEAQVEVGGSCEECLSYHGKTLNLLSDKLPPFHPNCTCKLTLIKKEGS